MGFPQQTVENLAGVGATGATSARIWLRVHEAGAHELLLCRAGGSEQRFRFELGREPDRDGVTSVCYPADFSGASPLEPLERYEFRVERCGDRVEIGSGEFETAPLPHQQAPERFSLAFTSCHQPFKSSGAIDPESLVLLNALEPMLEAEAVKRLVMSGDQMYADSPSELSLFDPDYFASVGPPGRRTLLECGREQVRALYQQRYRIFWQPPAFRRLQARLPVYMSFDDHEIVDNFGSRSVHSASAFSSVREGALDAAWDYQALRVFEPASERPPSLHMSFEYGPVAVFVMDLRSQRRRSPERLIVYGDDQHRDLERFLEQHAEKPVLVIVTGVPVVHVPDWLTTAVSLVDRGHTDISDRWSAPKARVCRRRLLGLLYEHQKRHPRQTLVLVGGDVHTGSVHELIWEDTEQRMFQLNASAISNRRTTALQWLMQTAPGLVQHIDIGAPYPRLRVHLMRGEPGREHNPFGELNLGLVECLREREQTRIRIKLVAHDPLARLGTRVVFSSQKT
jgi:alkaline phosphatase D